MLGFAMEGFPKPLGFATDEDPGAGLGGSTSGAGPGTSESQKSDPTWVALELPRAPAPPPDLPPGAMVFQGMVI